MKTDYKKIQTLVERVRNHEPDAFSDLYHETYQTIYFLSFSMLKDEYEAQDAVQETFLKISASIDTLSDNLLFPAWSNKIAYRICLEILAKRHEIPVEDIYFESLEEERDTYDPLRNTLLQERNLTLFRMIGNLSPVLRTTIVLRYYMGLKEREIASVMDCPVGTVKSRLSAARRQLLASIAAKKNHDILLGAYALLPMRIILSRAAEEIRLSTVRAQEILNRIIGAESAGVSGNISGRLAPASAGCIRKIIPAALVGAAAVSAAGLYLAANSALHISRLTVQGNYAQTSIISVELEDGTRPSQIYGISPSGKRIETASHRNQSYELSATENGLYTIYASDGHRAASASIEVFSVDREKPELLNYYQKDGLLIITFSDKKSGADMDSVYGTDAAGNLISPVLCSQEECKAVFSYPEEDFKLHISDYAGNELKCDVILQ